MVAHDAVGERQAEAGAGADRLGGEEGLEDLVAQLVRHAGTGIEDLDDRVAALGPGDHLDVVPGPAGIAGVGEEIHQHLGKALRVAVDLEPRADVCAELHALALVGQADQPDRLRDQFFHVDAFRGAADRSAATEAHQRLQDRGDAPGLSEYLVDPLAHEGRIRLVAKDLGERRDPRHRVADLVCDSCRETPDEGEPVAVRELGGQALAVGQVLEDHHQTGLAGLACNDIRVVHLGLVKIQPPRTGRRVDLE